MPKIRRRAVPEALLRHLTDRMWERGVSFGELGQLMRWLDTEPIVPDGKWYKRFPQFTVCGEGELVKTFLLPGQVPNGVEMP
jgi:hypothetical protein